MPDEKKPAAKKSTEQQLRPKTPNPAKVQKGGSSGSFSHSNAPKPKKGGEPRKAAPKPPKK